MRKFLFCVLIMLVGAGLFAQEAGQSASSGKTYNIGDTGPAGGIVFYDNGFYGDGWRYLEAAPAGSEFKAEWGSYKQDVTNTMAGIGFGKENTRLIVDRLNGLREVNRAAQRCAALDINGYKDWFLPSKDELNLVFRNLKMNELGGFGISWYWSSSEYGKRDAWNQSFASGFKDGNSKDRMGNVRAIRAF
ncbi:MAG: DUF1566 domain-containing protein [Treponema sp.]|jgi:hypothetical protein|nr:DUF1566 domain-containing protein [Treponema sp.]